MTNSSLSLTVSLRGDFRDGIRNFSHLLSSLNGRHNVSFYYHSSHGRRTFYTPTFLNQQQIGKIVQRLALFRSFLVDDQTLKIQSTVRTTLYIIGNSTAQKKCSVLCLWEWLHVRVFMHRVKLLEPPCSAQQTIPKKRTFQFSIIN